MSENILEDLHARGFRLTPQRLLILNILRQASCHLSPVEVYIKARQEMPGLTEPTVYRTLAFLSEQGLVMPCHVGNGQLMYEYTRHQHHHLICRVCGQQQEVEQSALEPLFNQFRDSTGYRIDSVHVTFFGLCPDCQEDQL